MRKKYLSALLFGALLFASAGTFTSCKDYDDDINNLQEQINTIASSLEDLKTKVDALGGYVENVTFADGVLSVTTGGNTVTYNIPDKTGVNEVALALEGSNLVLTVDGNKQTIELPSQEIPEIKVENGILYVGDKEYPLTVDVDNNVQIVDDNIPGNETIGVQINGETVAFPKAFADVRISLENDGDDFYFTDAKFANTSKWVNNGNPNDKQENGIHWTIASSDTKWDGPKGDIKAGLVVGQVTAAEVSVRPINYDLAAASKAGQLTLVSSKGEVAPVTVIATPGQKQGPLTNGSRAADVNFSGVNQGDYVLTLQFDKFTEGKEAEEIISKFANEDQTANIKYALALNGVVVTDYSFIIDTQLKADAQSSCEAPKPENFVIGGEGVRIYENIDGQRTEVVSNIPADGLYHNMSYLDGRIYDMKVAINAKDVNDAEVYGVEIKEDKENGTSSIMAGQNAVGRTFALDVTLIDINGNISKTETIYIKFAEAQKQTVTLSPVTYNVTPAADKSVLVDLGDVFSTLSASDAIAINSLSNITWAIENNDDNFLWTPDQFATLNNDLAKIMYYDENMKGIDVDDKHINENIKKIRYAKLVWNDADYANKDATDGEHLISITINRNINASQTGTSATRLVKKVNIPVHVIVPAWEDLFKTTSMWNADQTTFSTRLTGVDVDGKEVKVSMDAFEDVKNDWGGKLNDAITLEKLEYEDANGRMQNILVQNTPVNNVGTSNVKLSWKILTEAIEANNHVMPETFRNLSAKVSYTIGGVKEFYVDKEFTVYLMSIFEGADLAYYNADGAKADVAVMGADDIIKMATVSTDDKTAKDGVAIEFNGYKGEVSGLILAGGTNVQPISTAAGQEFKISWNATQQPDDAYTIYINKYTAQATSLTGADIDTTINSGLKVIPAKDQTGTIENGSTGSIMFQFVDAMGVYTQDTINFKKEVK
ncbi:hypothetical protein [Phocaeicola barnesiae]|uniref:hypothetical protein n=1 Tax=Phocaeicola barnesiae TaxID=376804 RepID=UPI00242E3EF8|nr:hypothetical protein [Phocaeicola barnesiae]